MLKSRDLSMPPFIGLIMTALKAKETTASNVEEFMACVTNGHIQLVTEQRRDTGIGSAGDELRLLVCTNSQCQPLTHNENAQT